MKTSSLLAASLALNAGLLAFLVFAPRDNRTDSAGPSGSTSSSSAAARSGDGSKTIPASGASPETLYAALKSGDHATLRDQLRALGFPESTIQGMIRAALWQPYYERQRAILASKNNDTQPYWRGVPSTGARAYTREERAELRELASQLRAQTIALLGQEGIDVRGTLSSRYNFLPPEKAAQLGDLDLDYGEMRQEINQEAERFRVPSDADKLKFLEGERRRDLESILSPAELADYDLHYSPAALSLRARLKQVDVSEAEYRSLFDLMKPFQDSLTNATAMAQPERRAAMEQISQQMQSLLGEDRFADFRRAMDSDYRQLQAAADRFNLAPTAINQIYALRESVSAETQRVADNAVLTPAQKKEALTRLAQQTREKVSATLGAEIATTYLEKNMKWLERVENGNAMTVSSTTNRVTFKPVAPAKRPPPPAPKPSSP